MKSHTGISQGFYKCTKATLQNKYFAGTPPDDCSALKYDHDIIIIKIPESLKETRNSSRKNDSSTLKNIPQDTKEPTCNYLRCVSLLICLR